MNKLSKIVRQAQDAAIEAETAVELAAPGSSILYASHDGSWYSVESTRGLDLQLLGTVGNTLMLSINGRKYAYEPLDGDMKELIRKFNKIYGFSAGKALAWLKKNTNLVGGSVKGVPKPIRGIPGLDPELLATVNARLAKHSLQSRAPKVELLGIIGNTMSIRIDGRKYVYEPAGRYEDGKRGGAEAVFKTFANMLHDKGVGDALSWLRKNTELVGGSVKGIPKMLRGIPKWDPYMSRTQRYQGTWGKN